MRPARRNAVWTQQLRYDDRGLLPVVAQDATTGEVLMVAYADRDALQRTADTGDAHYFSRSRQTLWRKGETSGHVQRVREIRADCDGDTVLYLVDQTGPACHTGEGSCFHRSVDTSASNLETAGPARPRAILDRLGDLVAERHEMRPDGSYTTYLFDQGIDKILKKVGEESAEVIIAAKNGSHTELRNESADLFYHLLVLLRAADLPIGEVWRTLEERFSAPDEDTGADA